jgi:hypothetical protein
MAHEKLQGARATGGLVGRAVVRAVAEVIHGVTVDGGDSKDGEVVEGAGVGDEVGEWANARLTRFAARGDR